MNKNRELKREGEKMAEQALDGYKSQNEAQEDNKFEEVNFEEIRDKLEQDFKDSGSSKPILETNTNAVVDEVVLKRAFNPKQDSQGKEFYDTILTIKTILSDGRESYDNYGGLREYGDGYWNSKKSAFGKLQALMVEEFGIKNRQEMIRKLSNAKVKIRTEKTTFNGNEYQKNIIKSFRE
jgi:hypothetical protein